MAMDVRVVDELHHDCRQASVAPPDVSNYGPMPLGRSRTVSWITGAVCVVSLAACNRRETPAPASPLRVSAAISLTDVLGGIAKRWEAAGNPHVELNFAGSNVLARQILEGAPADVFISADAAQMDRVVSGGSADPADRVSLAANQLVVVVPTGRPLSGMAPDSLANDAVKRVAIGDPQGVPAGVYAKTWLERVGLWRRIEPKIVPSASVRAALVAVEAANADAGIVYRTDAAANSKVTVAYEVPLGDAPPILYPGAVLKHAAHPEAARKFVAFLQSAASRETFAARGFLAPDTAAAR
jgi:molybdate transport system substrate-binding protein